MTLVLIRSVSLHFYSLYSYGLNLIPLQMDHKTLPVRGSDAPLIPLVHCAQRSQLPSMAAFELLRATRCKYSSGLVQHTRNPIPVQRVSPNPVEFSL
jgi:hypothetical protein